MVDGKPNRESSKAAIAEKANYLEKQGGERLDWVSLTIGQVTLKKRRIKLNWRKTSKVYELNHISLLDESTGQYPARRYIFTEKGIIAGVVESRIDAVEPDFSRVEESMKFQVEEGLFAPRGADYEALDRVLESGLIDAPIE